jgi:hypothetical protein
VFDKVTAYMSGKPASKTLLTDRALKALSSAPKGKRIKLWDAAQQHFGVRITDHGVKTFFVEKRAKGQSRPVTHVIGTYPEIGLAAARKQAKEALEMLAEGAIPRVERQRALEAEQSRTETAFKAVAKEFIEKHLVKNRSRAESERIINTYLIPRFGQHQITDIKRREITGLLDDLEQGKFRTPDSRACGGPVMADRVLAA